MVEIQWMEIGDSYIAELQYGKVVISPKIPATPNQPYTARIETTSGKVVGSFEWELEACKSWASANLPLMDEVSGKLDDCGNVLETLNLCQKLLSIESDPTHWLRIEHIKRWMAQYIDQTYEIVDIPLPKHSYDNLEWVEHGAEFIAETPHGRAVIEEIRSKGVIGGGIKHNAKIIHRSGASLNCYSWIDFIDAENAIKKQLNALDDPYIDESHLDIMGFTLEICKRVLPVDSDPIHYARLGNLGVRIH